MDQVSVACGRVGDGGSFRFEGGAYQPVFIPWQASAPLSLTRAALGVGLFRFQRIIPAVHGSIHGIKPGPVVHLGRCVHRAA